MAEFWARRQPRLSGHAVLAALPNVRPTLGAAGAGSTQMSDIFDEVSEEVRRSRAEQLWKRYGWIVIGVCVAVVGSVAVWRYLEWTREKVVEAGGVLFEMALEDIAAGRRDEGIQGLRFLTEHGADAYRVLARFRLAAEQAKTSPAEAIAAFDGVAADAKADATIRDMARLRAGALAVDALPLAEVERRLSPLTSGENAFRHQANEFIAVAALKAGDAAKAQRHLDAIIIDRGAPSDMRDRAGTLIGIARGAK
jgi:hypothetical protein